MDELSKLIADRIRQNDGWISFEDFMRMALHEPGLGYYAGGNNPVGAQGDFTTAAQESAIYARTFARCVVEAMPEDGKVLEIGGGSGTFMCRLAQEMESLGNKAQVLALETSAALSKGQQELAGQHGLSDRCEWITKLPEDFRGVIIANEVLDAQPCSVCALRGDQWVQRGVALSSDGKLEWADGPAVGQQVLERVSGLELPDGYQLEMNFQAEALVATLASTLKTGTVLITDYGFPRHEIYHPQRSQGTLSSHRAHMVEPDVLAHPGAQDITAHVDFTAMADAARNSGAKVAGFTTQAAFLLELGISSIAEEHDDLASRAKTSHEMQTLLMPHEMGELFKVLALAKGKAKSPPGFSLGDRLHSLWR